MYFMQPNIIYPMCIQELTKVIPAPIQIIVAICKQINILIFFNQVSSMLVNVQFTTLL
jgi:hypothetical protein